MPTPSRYGKVDNPSSADPARAPARHRARFGAPAIRRTPRRPVPCFDACPPARPAGPTTDRASVVSAPKVAVHSHPWRRFLIGPAILLSGLACVGLASAADQLLFGPRTYIRTSGPPTEVLETVPVPPTLTAPFRLHVQNGNPDGSARVSSATITLNGTPVAGPADFTQGAAGFDRIVILHATNTLQVRLASSPGSLLILTLFGTLPPPTLSSFEPPTLPITQGGTGTLTATISAVQVTDTPIAVTSSAPGIAAVPAEMTIPVGSVAVPVPVVALSVGTAILTAALHGSTLQATVTVSPSGPTLTSLLPNTLPIAQGAAGTLTVTLSAAQATETVVALSSNHPSQVGLPPDQSVTIPAGQGSQAFAVFGVSPGTATITASLNGTIVQSQVTVGAPLPTVVSLLPPTLPLTEGSSGTLTLTLNATQPTPTEVVLITSDPTIVGLPSDRLFVPANTLAVAFPVTGLARGLAGVTVHLNGSQATSAVTVSPPPPRLHALTCPATLTRDATGVCTVTLAATQLADTVVPLAAAPADVLGVPSTVTIPAGALSVAVPVLALALGDATLTAGPLHGTTQTATLQVLPPPPTIESLLPSPGALTVGATATLTLTLNAAQATDTVVPLAAHPVGIVVVAPSVIVPAGTLTVPVPVVGLTPGTTTLTAGPLNGTQAHSTLTVNRLPPTLTELTPPTLTLAKGRVGELTLTIAPTQPEATIVVLASSAPSTVAVPAGVTVPAGANTATIPVLTWAVGTATLTAGPLNGSTQTATVTVTPAELVTLTLTPPAPAIPKGQTQAFTLTGTYTDGTTQDLTDTATWTSSDLAVATITSGFASGLTAGTTTITATAGSLTTSATLTVTPPILASLTVAPEAPTRLVGQSVQLLATGTLTDGTAQDFTGGVTWTSSTPTVASITSPGGLVTALAAGSTTLTATHPDGFTATALLTVLSPPPTLTITSPADGAALAADRVMVRGTVTAVTAEVGVLVNGTAAQVNSGQWAVEVPLQPGPNVLTALAMTAQGGQATVSLTVTATSIPTPTLRVQAVPESGVAPLTVRWQVTNQTGRTLVRYELDPLGTGTFGAPLSTLDGTQMTYITPGLVIPVIRATDDQGAVYTASTAISVLDRSQLDGLLQAKWAGMKAALMANDIEGALRYFLPSQHERYRTLLTALNGALAQIAMDMAPIQLIALEERRAKYRLPRTQPYAGQLVVLTYYVYFVQTAAGDWGIEGF